MSSSPKRLIDSHIHLWPGSSAHPLGHGWMQPGHHLTRQYAISDYLTSSSSCPPTGFVYVETDRYLPRLPEDLSSDETFQAYIKEPLAEMAFLRRIAEGEPQQGEGHEPEHAALMKGAVAWAPIQLGVEGLDRYLIEAKKVAGDKTWALIKGFRFLLQGIKDQAEFTKLALGTNWIEGLKELGRRGYAFDVGVDQRQGGVWQLDVAGQMIKRMREDGSQTIFILNHLCKPNIEGQLETATHKEDFKRWTAALESVAKYDGVYMKLSGAFSELGDQDSTKPWPTNLILERMEPWLDVVFKVFSPSQIMFGSDWPVCCVRGPGDEHSWRSWKELVVKVLDKYQLTEENKDRIWYGTAVEAYKLAI